MLEVIHRKKVDSYLPLSMLFERYLSQNTGIVDLGKFCNWVRLEGNDSFVHPLLALQVHLRTKLLGNHFWDDLAKERKADEYLRNTLNAMQLQNEIISTARKEKEKQRLEKLEEERLERIGKGKNGDTRDYNTRKRSFLLDFFNLKAEAPSEDRAKGVYCTSAPDEPKMDRQAEILKQTKLKPGGAMSVIEAVHHTETNHKQQKQNRKSRVSNANQVHVPENKTKEEAFGYRRKDRLSRESVGSEEVDTKKSSTGKRLQKAKSLAQGLDSRQATTGVSLAVRRRGIVTTFEQLPKRMIAPDVEDESDISDVHRAALQNKRKERYTIDTADYYSNPSAGNDNRPMSV